MKYLLILRKKDNVENYIFIILIGGIVGSFLKACINRISNEKNVLFPIRVHSKHKVSLRYTSINFFSSISFGIIYYCYGISIETVLGCTFIAFAIVLSMIDWDQMILPTSIIRWGMGIGLIERILQAKITGSWFILVDALMGAIVGYLLLMLMFYISKWLLKKEGMGYGDVRLMGMIGLFTGLHMLFLALLISSILASIYGIVLLRIKMKSEAYPLGPFLNIGGVLVFMWGNNMLKMM